MAARGRFRSVFESEVAADLERNAAAFAYEATFIQYERPAKRVRYTPDFVITTRSGKTIYVETKGRFFGKDRVKHKLIQKQRPELDIRFVFQNPRLKIVKGSKTTCAMWCEANGFQWAERSVPKTWLSE